MVQLMVTTHCKRAVRKTVLLGGGITLRPLLITTTGGWRCWDEIWPLSPSHPAGTRLFSEQHTSALSVAAELGVPRQRWTACLGSAARLQLWGTAGLPQRGCNSQIRQTHSKPSAARGTENHSREEGKKRKIKLCPKSCFFPHCKVNLQTDRVQKQPGTPENHWRACSIKFSPEEVVVTAKPLNDSDYLYLINFSILKGRIISKIVKPNPTVGVI